MGGITTISYADELLKDLRNILDTFNTYHIPIEVNGQNIKDIKLEKDSKGDYKINVTLMEDLEDLAMCEIITDNGTVFHGTYLQCLEFIRINPKLGLSEDDIIEE